MAVTEGRTKKLPTFHYLPNNRAKRLKKSWVEDHKIRSKWKAQKRREGLTNQTTAPVEDVSNHDHDEPDARSVSDMSLPHPEKSSVSTPFHEKQPLRDLRKTAYGSKLFRTPTPNSSHSERASGHSYNTRGGKATAKHETGQPNMGLRMNVLLERIKRNLS